MAISEACQLWIEQRCRDELESREAAPNPKSLRTIGREIAGEILRYFEAQVSPETLSKRLQRMSGTNVPPSATPEDDEGIGENQSPFEEIKAPREHRATGEPKGGEREGAGRKPKNEPPQSHPDHLALVGAYDEFCRQVTVARVNQWKSTPKEVIMSMLQNLVSLIEG